MKMISPALAAELSAGVYGVLNDRALELFLESVSIDFGRIKTFKASVGFRSISVDSSFAVAARGSGDYKNDIFLIFRGTTGRNYGADIITDLRIGFSLSLGGDIVHSGFQQCLNSMTEGLGSFLAQHRDATTVHCIGHSLGGAVATLAADWVLRTQNKAAKLYTFGAPRVGMPGFGNKFSNRIGANNIHRVNHLSDPVTMIPVFPYAHAPSPAYCLPYGGIVMNFKAHKIANYVQSSGANSWQQLQRQAPIQFSAASIKQWLKTDSPSHPNDSTVWEKLNYALAVVAQSCLAPLQSVICAGLTLADQLAMLLQKGIAAGKEIASWVFYIIRKMMKMLGMKIVETVEDLTTSLIRMVLNRIVNRMAQQVRQAISFLK